MRFSIIIPCYNCQKYLKRCLDSLCNQNLKNFEVILIDDASTDNSLDIASTYLEKLNLKIIKNSKNKGSATSRILGAKSARNEYLLFLDADDSIERCLKQIKDIVDFNNSDMTIFGSNEDIDFYMPNKNYFKKLLQYKENWSLATICIKKNIFISAIESKEFKSLYKKGNMYEDFILTLFIVDDCEKISKSEYHYYNYFKNPNSLTHKPINLGNFFNYLIPNYLEMVFHFLKKWKIKENCIKKIIINKHLQLFSNCLYDITKSNSKEQISDAIKSQQFKPYYCEINIWRILFSKLNYKNKILLIIFRYEFFYTLYSSFF